MAHSPEVRAAAVADLMKGMTLRAVGAKHGVPWSTVKKWNKDAQNELSPKVKIKTGVASASRRSSFQEKFLRLADQVMEMYTVQAAMLADPEYIQSRRSDEIVEHSRFIGARFERLVAIAGGSVPAEQSEVIEASAEAETVAESVPELPPSIGA